MTTSQQPTARDPAKATYWRLLAIALDPDDSKPALYGLIYEGESDVPLTVDGRIALFSDPSRARALIERYGGALVADEIDVDRPFFWCDLAQALHYLSAGGIDREAAVLDAVNVLLDLVRASGARVDVRRGQALRAIADYCTTHQDLTRYFDEDGDYSSDELVDAVLWCIGAVVAKAKIV